MSRRRFSLFRREDTAPEPPPAPIPRRIVKYGWAGIVTLLAVLDLLLSQGPEGGRWRRLVDACLNRGEQQQQAPDQVEPADQVEPPPPPPPI